MTSPGGTEVGRVSIRVLPDSSGFRAKLRAELQRSANDEVKIKVDPDFTGFAEKVRAELARISKQGTRIKVGVDLQSAVVKSRLKAIVDQASAGIKATIEIEWWPPVTVLRTELRLMVLEAQRGISAEVDVNFRADRNSLQRLVGGLGGAGGGGGGFGGTGQFARIFQRYGALIAAASPLIVIAGAAITEAWATVSAAIMAVPPALALIAAPIITVVLGVDGIKKAFGGVKKEVDELKNQISGAFASSLNYAAMNVRFLLQKIISSKVGAELATSISNVMQMVSQTLVDNGQKIVDIIAVISDRIRGLGPGISAFILSLLKIMNVRNAFDSVTIPLDTFLRKWSEMVDTVVNNGTLTSAFDGLAGVLSSLLAGFVDLVHNGLTVFTTSAGGTKKFLDELTAFFNRFDWQKLGTAVGDVFDGIGKALASVSPATIEEITVAFQTIGTVFQDAGLQRSFGDMIALIPTVILLFAGFIEIIGRVGAVASGVIQILEGVALALIGFGQIQFGNVEDGLANIRDASIVGKNGMQALKDAFTFGGPEVQSAIDKINRDTGGALDRLKNNIQVKFSQLPSVVTGYGKSVATNVIAGLQPIMGAAQRQLDGALKPGDKDYAGPWTAKTNQINSAVKTGMDGVTLTGQAGANATAKAISPAEGGAGVWETVKTAFLNLFADMGVSLGAAWLTVQDAIFGPGSIGIPSKAAGAFSGVPPAVGAALAPTEGTAGAELNKVAVSASTAASNTVGALSSGLAPVPGAAGAAGSGAAAGMGVGMTNMTSQVRTGVANSGTEAGRLPSTVQSGIGNVDSTLTDSGSSIINGFLAGMKSAFGPVLSWAISAMAELRRVWPFSPAKIGPFSGKGWVLYSGISIMEGFAEGISRGLKNALSTSMSAMRDVQSVFSDPIHPSFATDTLTAGFSTDLTSHLSSDGFGIDYSRIAGAVVDGLTGSTLNVDGNGVAKLVNKKNLRDRRR